MKTISISKWVAAVAMTVLSSFTAFAQITNLNLGNLAPGETVTITFDVTLNSPLPDGLRGITNQAAVSAAAIAMVNSDDPKTIALGDPTVTLLDPTPVLLGISNRPPASVMLFGSGLGNIDIEASTNLVNWFMRANVVPDGAGRFEYNDTRAFPQLFYRLKSAPQ